MDIGDLKRKIQERIDRQPGLPSPHPTVSAWQEVPHPKIAATQSPTLPEDADVVVIGSGVTGCGVAYALLHDSSAAAARLRVTILEARNAVSGATGRNGGHLVSDADSLFPYVLKEFGLEQAVKTVHFSEANIARLKSVAAKLQPADFKTVDLREVTSATGFSDEEMFEEAKRITKQLEDTVPGQTLVNKVYSKNEAETKFGLRDIVGCIAQVGVCALWPYRLFTAVYDSLLREFGDRFTLETNTPVTTIGYDTALSHPYLLETPRGTLRAKRVIHCTNGYSAHLIPTMVGKLWPLRGTMSVQTPGPSFPRLGSEVSWTRLEKGSYDPENEVFTTGLYYAQQNAETGDVWVGGESQTLDGLLTSDDSNVRDEARANILTILPRIWRDTEPLGPAKVWSGIMGFTSDGLPFVGKLSPRMTGRPGDGEWIAGGFNGHGMDKCWLSAEAVARMALHGDTPEWLPDIYILSDERLDMLKAETSVNNFLDAFAIN